MDVEKKHPSKLKKIANNLLEITCPVNVRIFWSKLPPDCFHPLAISHSYMTFNTSIGFCEDDISIIVVLSLLEALRKKNNPIARRIVSIKVELREWII